MIKTIADCNYKDEETVKRLNYENATAIEVSNCLQAILSKKTVIKKEKIKDTQFRDLGRTKNRKQQSVLGVTKANYGIMQSYLFIFSVKCCLSLTLNNAYVKKTCTLLSLLMLI